MAHHQQPTCGPVTHHQANGQQRGHYCPPAEVCSKRSFQRNKETKWGKKKQRNEANNKRENNNNNDDSNGRVVISLKKTFYNSDDSDVSRNSSPTPSSSSSRQNNVKLCVTVKKFGRNRGEESDEEEKNRHQRAKIGSLVTLKPYVPLTYRYDGNDCPFPRTVNNRPVTFSEVVKKPACSHNMRLPAHGAGQEASGPAKNVDFGRSFQQHQTRPSSAVSAGQNLRRTQSDPSRVGYRLDGAQHGLRLPAVALPRPVSFAGFGDAFYPALLPFEQPYPICESKNRAKLRFFYTMAFYICIYRESI
jgi:hypothetical protein